MSADESSGPAKRLDTDGRVGTTLSERYRIDRLLGEGGMGRVYAATHIAMRKRVAVKILHRDLTKVPEVIKRFEREAMAAANIDHPNVAAATDFGKLDDGSVFLVLEYVSGRSLRDEMATGPMVVDRALHITRQMSAALATAHELDIVHRDLKPENVMLVEKGAEADFVKVLDFGIAKVPIGDAPTQGAAKEGEAITKVGMVFGTPEYMPPEQALGQPVDARADIYALGIMVYELLTGSRPFGGNTQVEVLGQQLAGPPPPMVEKGVTVSPVIEQLVRMMLAKEVAQRVQSAKDLVVAIDQIRGRPGSIPDTGSIPDLTSQHDIIRPGSIPDVSTPGSIPDVGVSSERRLALPSGSIPDPGPGSIPDTGGSIPDILSPGSLPGTTPVSAPASLADASGPHSAAEPPGIPTWFEGLRPALPGPLKKLPPMAFVAAAGFAVVAVVFLVGVIAARALSSDPAPTPSGSAAVGAPPGAPVGSAASKAELDAAKSEGVKALDELAKKYPDDVALLLELAKAHELDRNVTDAVGAIGRVLSLDPSLSKDEWIASALWRASQSKDAGDAAFALLEGPMGEKGADIMYDLVITQGIRAEVVARAEAFLKSQEFQKRSSPALNVAVALKYAKSCEQRKGLLMRAKNQGDARALKFLRQLENKSGCGRRGQFDCWKCVRGDDRLKDAIEAIEKRRRG